MYALKEQGHNLQMRQRCFRDFTIRAVRMCQRGDAMWCLKAFTAREKVSPERHCRQGRQQYHEPWGHLCVSDLSMPEVPVDFNKSLGVQRGNQHKGKLGCSTSSQEGQPSLGETCPLCTFTSHLPKWLWSSIWVRGVQLPSLSKSLFFNSSHCADS